MSYLVLARKWRPQTFSDLVGQEHVSRTLANAIAQNRVAHAFLFTGVRGVGKTTSARIMAKALNCEKGPTATPCLTCSPCVEIAKGTDLDVQEIDGASYNGIDEVRRLQESLPYRPARDRFKIFIVDEVHMLSQSAWNAFLKTLEEPPPHVKFIFATTEVHKVPVTILSRCQRYDFKLIPTQLVAKRLSFVLTEEGIKSDDLAVQTIAREAAGSLRDAMSLLDQAIAWGGTELVGEEVARVLGVAARSALGEIAANLVAGDPAGCLKVVESLADQGYDIGHVTRDLLAHLRDLVVARVCKEPGTLLDLADDEVRLVRDLAGRASAEDLARLHQGFSKAFDEIARSSQPRHALEMTLVRLACRPPLLPLDNLLTRLGELEKRLSGTHSPTPSPGSAGGGGTGSGGGQAGGGGGGPSGRFTGPMPARASAGHVSGPAMGSVATSAARVLVPVAAVTAVAPTQVTPAPVPTPVVAAAPLPVARVEPLPDVDLAAWRTVLEALRRERQALASVFEHAVPLAFGPDRVVLGYEADSFLATQATEEEAVGLLTRLVRAHFAEPTAIAFDLTVRAKGLATVATIDLAAQKARVEETRRAVAQHPLVKAAIEILGAELRDIRLPGGTDDSGPRGE